MRIAIIGYGKMGHMIETIATDRGHEIGSTIDLGDEHLLASENLRQHDVAIEFTTPGTAFDNIVRCLDAGLPVVSGTTGWTDGLDELKTRCEKENLSFLYASNFNLGVNIMAHLNRQLAGIMNRYEQYDVDITEIHHTEKLDAPSGTALSLAEAILKHIDRKKGWTLSGSGGKDELQIRAVREGNIAGIHEVNYRSEFDEMTLRHAAKDRRGFAIGAVLAAEFIKEKRGFFTMEDLLDF